MSNENTEKFNLPNTEEFEHIQCVHHGSRCGCFNSGVARGRQSMKRKLELEDQLAKLEADNTALRLLVDKLMLPELP